MALQVADLIEQNEQLKEAVRVLWKKNQDQEQLIMELEKLVPKKHHRRLTDEERKTRARMSQSNYHAKKKLRLISGGNER